MNQIKKINPYVDYDGQKFHKSKLVNNLLNKNIKISTDRVFRSMQAKQVVDFNYDFNDTGNSIQLTDIIATLATICTSKQKELGVVFLIVNKIIYRNAQCHFVLLEKLAECKFQGNVLTFDKLVDFDLKWTGEYGNNISCDGQFCVTASLDIRAAPTELDDSFEYFIKSAM